MEKQGRVLDALLEMLLAGVMFTSALYNGGKAVKAHRLENECIRGEVFFLNEGREKLGDFLSMYPGTHIPCDYATAVSGDLYISYTKDTDLHVREKIGYGLLAGLLFAAGIKVATKASTNKTKDE